MKNITINEDTLLKYINHELSKAEMYEVEEYLLHNENAFNNIANFINTKNDNSLQQSIKTLDDSFYDLLNNEKKVINESIENEDRQYTDYLNGQLDIEDSFQMEEALLNKDLSEIDTISNIQESLSDASKKLDTHFHTLLQKEPEPAEKKRHILVQKWKWLSIAASISVLILFSFFFNPSSEIEYQTLGIHNSEINEDYQEVINTNQLFQNKLNRLLRFQSKLNPSQLENFKRELLELCSTEATILLIRENDSLYYSASDFLNNLSSIHLFKFEVIESTIEENSNNLIFTSKESYQLKQNNEISYGSYTTIDPTFHQNKTSFKMNKIVLKEIK